MVILSWPCLLQWFIPHKNKSCNQKKRHKTPTKLSYASTPLHHATGLVGLCAHTNPRFFTISSNTHHHTGNSVVNNIAQNESVADLHCISIDKEPSNKITSSVILFWRPFWCFSKGRSQGTVYQTTTILRFKYSSMLISLFYESNTTDNLTFLLLFSLSIYFSTTQKTRAGFPYPSMLISLFYKLNTTDNLAFLIEHLFLHNTKNKGQNPIVRYFFHFSETNCRDTIKHIMFIQKNTLATHRFKYTHGYEIRQEYNGCHNHCYLYPRMIKKNNSDYNFLL